jgi:hypothetical protein
LLLDSRGAYVASRQQRVARRCVVVQNVLSAYRDRV